MQAPIRAERADELKEDIEDNQEVRIAIEEAKQDDSDIELQELEDNESE